jgi:hypothetical protein
MMKKKNKLLRFFKAKKEKDNKELKQDFDECIYEYVYDYTYDYKYNYKYTYH